jgi:hypothetical protein
MHFEQQLFAATLAVHIASGRASFAAGPLFLFGKVDGFLALRGAAVLILRLTRIALNKEHVAAFIHTVGMVIEGCSALVTVCNDIFGDALRQSLIEYKVDTQKPVLKSALLHIPGVLNDAALELVDVRKSLVLEVR